MFTDQLMQPALLDSAQRAPLIPDDSVADVRHGLTFAGVFHGVKTRLLAHWHVAKNLAGPAIQSDYPAGRPGRLVQLLHPRPQRPTRAQLERIRSSQVGELAQKLSVEVEFLNPPVLAVSNIKDIVLIDYDRVRQMELPRTRARTAPLANLLAIDRVL